MSTSDDVITASVGEFVRISGLGRTTIYSLLSRGLLESIKVGKRRLVLLDSYRKLIERQRVDAEAPTRRAVR